MNKSNGTKVSLAVVQNDVKHISDAIAKIDIKFDKVCECYDNLENRTQKLEDRIDFAETSFQKGIAKIGAILGALGIIVGSIVSWLLKG